MVPYFFGNLAKKEKLFLHCHFFFFKGNTAFEKALGTFGILTTAKLSSVMFEGHGFFHTHLQVF